MGVMYQNLHFSVVPHAFYLSKFPLPRHAEFKEITESSEDQGVKLEQFTEYTFTEPRDLEKLGFC